MGVVVDKVLVGVDEEEVSVGVVLMEVLVIEVTPRVVFLLL